METANDINTFLSTVSWALKERYRMIFTLNEIRQELNMPLVPEPPPSSNIIVHPPASLPKSLVMSNSIEEIKTPSSSSIQEIVAQEPKKKSVKITVTKKIISNK